MYIRQRFRIDTPIRTTTHPSNSLSLIPLDFSSSRLSLVFSLRKYAICSPPVVPYYTEYAIYGRSFFSLGERNK